MAKFTITVRGNGDFPFDMLRHDESWPASAADSVKLGDTTRRTIRLLSNRNPTDYKWVEFGRGTDYVWTLVAVNLN